jgi:hypothetical protein
MLKKLTKYGNSLDLLKIDTETPFGISKGATQAVRQGIGETGQVEERPELTWDHCSYLSMKCWRCTSSRLTDTADRLASLIPEGCNCS